MYFYEALGILQRNETKAISMIGWENDRYIYIKAMKVKSEYLNEYLCMRQGTTEIPYFTNQHEILSNQWQCL